METSAWGMPVLLYPCRTKSNSSNFISQKLSVRDIEQIARKSSSGKKTAKASLSAEQERTREELADMLGTKVDLVVNDNGKGNIKIPFTSEEDLERILEALGL